MHKCMYVLLNKMLEITYLGAILKIQIQRCLGMSPCISVPSQSRFLVCKTFKEN